MRIAPWQQEARARNERRSTTAPAPGSGGSSMKCVPALQRVRTTTDPPLRVVVVVVVVATRESTVSKEVAGDRQRANRIACTDGVDRRLLAPTEHRNLQGDPDMTRPIWLAAGLRTPFTKVDGGLAKRDAIALGVPVLQAM